MTHEMTADEKECYKDVASIGNEYVLRMLLLGMEVFSTSLRMYTHEDRFLSLKEELHRCKKVVRIRREEVVAANKEAES